MFYVYLLENEKEELYTGYTSDLRKRVEEHNNGKNTSTKRGIPWKCVYYEACIEESDAKRRERYLKGTEGSRLLKRRIKDYMYNKRLAN